MRDRTNDLQGNGDGNPEPTSPRKKKEKKKKSNDDAAVPSDMNQFFEELAETKENIAAIKISVDEIRAIHDRTLNNVISEQQNAEITRELDACMDKANRQAGVVRTKLKEMDSVNKKLQKNDPNGNDTTIRVSQHGVLTKSFLEVMTEYKKIQETYQAKFKDRMQRQALIVKPNATKEEVERMIEGEGQMFAKQIVNSGQRMEAKRALEDIQSKHKEVVKIEKSILELQQLFMDMAVLVAAQGEVIDQIAVHIESAVNDTDAGVVALKKAVEIQKKTRKSQDTLAETEKRSWLSALQKEKPKGESEQSKEMQDFLESISYLKGEIIAVEGGLASINEIQNRQLETITDEQEKAAAMELDQAMDKIQSKNKIISAELKKIDKDTKAMKGKNASQEVPIRNAQYAVLLQSFSKTIQDFKQLQIEHQARLKERMTRHVLTVNPNATKNDIEKALLGEKVFAPQNMTQRAEARAALAEISKKHEDVAKLTNSILELNQLFMDITVLVNAQGAQIDKIGGNVGIAIKETDEGVDALQKAIKKQRKNRKRMLIIIFIVAIIIAIIVTVISVLR